MIGKRHTNVLQGKAASDGAKSMPRGVSYAQGESDSISYLRSIDEAVMEFEEENRK